MHSACIVAGSSTIKFGIFGPRHEYLVLADCRESERGRGGVVDRIAAKSQSPEAQISNLTICSLPGE